MSVVPFPFTCIAFYILLNWQDLVEMFARFHFCWPTWLRTKWIAVKMTDGWMGRRSGVHRVEFLPTLPWKPIHRIEDDILISSHLSHRYGSVNDLMLSGHQLSLLPVHAASLQIARV